MSPSLGATGISFHLNPEEVLGGGLCDHEGLGVSIVR
jgi:hypothetical protein